MISIASSYVSYANTTLVLCGLIIAALTIILTIYYNRNQKKLIEESIDKFLKEVSNNEGLQNKLIEAIVQNENFKSDIERLIALMIPKNQQKTSDRETSLKELR